MNANSKPPAQTVSQWLAGATMALRAANISSARLDAEVILAHVLGKTRTWLITHSEDFITDLLSIEGLEDNKKTALTLANTLLEKRAQRIPLAYLIGFKEFYGRDFIVTPDVLIPRPESEMIIHVLRELWAGPMKHREIIDVGTGSGCLGITAMLEIPGTVADLSDVSEKALAVAQRNIRKWKIRKHQYYESDLLDLWEHAGVTKPSIDAILANLPYVNPAWERSPETNYEPSLALFADDNGMELIKKLITQAEPLIKPGGYLLLEADPEQHEPIIKYGGEHHFAHLRTDDYIVTLQR